MSDSSIEPLEPELARLLDAERAADGPTPAEGDQVFSRVSSTLGWSGPPAGGGSTGGTDAAASGARGAPGLAGGLGKMTLVAALSFGAGGAVGAWVHATVSRPPAVASPASASAPAPAPPAPVLGAPPATTSAPPSVAASATPTSSTPPAKRAAPQVTASPDETLARERSLVQGARMAILRGQPAAALDLLTEHEARFAHGQLTEERDALRVEALARADRVDEARERAARFRSTYPQSLFLPAIDASLAAPGGPRSIP